MESFYLTHHFLLEKTFPRASCYSLTFVNTHSELKKMFLRSRFSNSLAPMPLAVLMIAFVSVITSCASTGEISEHAPVIAQIEPSSKTQLKNSENSATEQASEPQLAPAEPIQILGGVKKPGTVPYREGANLSFYLSEAGASTAENDSAKIQIIRGEPGKKKAQEFNLSDGTIPPLRSGDIVIVHSPAKKTFIEKSIAVAASAAAILGTAALLILVV